MHRKITLLTIAAALVATVFISAPLAAAPVLEVTAVDTHGNTQEYLKRLELTIKIGKSLAPSGIWRVWVANYSGPSTGMVYITVEYESHAALAEADAAFEASDEFAASVAALAEMGRTIESRSILNDRTQ